MALELAEREWLYLSQTMYRLNRISREDIFRETCLRFLQVAIPYTKALSFLSERVNGGVKHSSPICIQEEPFDESIYLSGNYTTYWREFMYSPWSIVYRHSDYMDGPFAQTRVYKDIYIPQNIHYCLHMALIYEDNLLGLMSFFRPKSSANFSEKEYNILNILKEHLALKLWELIGKPAEAHSREEISSKISEKYNLTPREQEITELIFIGKTRSQISECLFISDSTLRKHIYNIKQKTGTIDKIQILNSLDFYSAK